MELANLDRSALTLRVNRDEGRVSGFTLTAIETYAECYCMSFPTAQMKGKGRITLSDGQMHFEHGGVSLEEADERLGIYGASTGGLLSMPIEPNDAKALESFLNRSGDYANTQIRVRYEQAWGKGFTVYAKSV